MVIDSSALIAILLGEPERRAFIELIAADATRLVSTATFVETAILVESRKGAEGAREFDLFRYRARLDLVSLDADQAEIARIAYRRFGKGRHAAALNYGNCFVYALAKTTGEPVLFKGADFSLTDLVPVTAT